MFHLAHKCLLASALFAADAPSPAPVNPQAELLKLAGPLILMFVIFYFLLIRPQQKKQKQHQALLAALKPRDKVVTNSGLVGEVIALKDKTLTLRCGESKLEVLKSAVADVFERAQPQPDAKS
jgi:preprotein translocase subunit YajC